MRYPCAVDLENDLEADLKSFVSGHDAAIVRDVAAALPIMLLGAAALLCMCAWSSAMRASRRRREGAAGATPFDSASSRRAAKQLLQEEMVQMMREAAPELTRDAASVILDHEEMDDGAPGSAVHSESGRSHASPHRHASRSESGRSRALPHGYEID